mgnify:CR=1 FL=1
MSLTVWELNVGDYIIQLNGQQGGTLDVVSHFIELTTRLSSASRGWSGEPGSQDVTEGQDIEHLTVDGRQVVRCDCWLSLPLLS